MIARKFTALGFKRSKGSVIGHAFRNGLANVMRRMPRHAAPKKIASGAALFVKIKATRPAVGVPPTPPAAGDFLGLTILDLQSDSCRYPHGEPTLFCGQPQREGSAYCDHHHKLSHTKGSWT